MGRSWGGGRQEYLEILSGKPTGKRPFKMPKRRWEDKIRMGLEEIGVNARNWVDSAQDRDYWRALEPPGFISHVVM